MFPYETPNHSAPIANPCAVEVRAYKRVPVDCKTLLIFPETELPMV